MANYSYRFKREMQFRHVLVDFKDAERNAAQIEAGVTGIELVPGPGIDLSKVQVNLDHHGPDCTAETPAACDQAMTVDMTEIPRKCLYSRLDADSLVAGAILELRASAALGVIDPRDIDEDIVRAVSALDRKGPAGLTDKEREHLPDASFLGRVAFDRDLSFDQKLRIAMGFLLIQDYDAAQAKADDVEEANSLRQKELEQARAELQVEKLPSGLVVVKGNSRFAANLIYELGDVGVAFNSAFPVDFKDPSKGTCKKATIMKRDSNVPLNMKALADALNQEESELGGAGKWGGRGEIIGSPMGQDYLVSDDRVVALTIAAMNG